MTKARPTAYDSYGNTVPASKIKVDYEKRDESDRIDLDMEVDIENMGNDEETKEEDQNK